MVPFLNSVPNILGQTDSAPDCERGNDPEHAHFVGTHVIKPTRRGIDHIGDDQTDQSVDEKLEKQTHEHCRDFEKPCDSTANLRG